MIVSDFFLIGQIVVEDGAAIKAMIDEMTSNPIMIRGLQALKHAGETYVTQSSTGRAAAERNSAAGDLYKPAATPDVHKLIWALQEHAKGNPDAEIDGGSHGVAP